MTLQDYLDRYNQNRDIEPSTLEHYHWVVRSIQSFAGVVKLSDISVDLCNRWLLWMRDNGRSPFTVNSRRNAMLVLWRAAWREGLAPQPGEIRVIRLPDPSKEIWSQDEVARLVDFCAVLSGRFRRTNIQRANYFRSLIQAAYDSGLRQSDLHRVTVASVASSSRMGILQQKTRRTVVIRLHEQTVDAIRQFVTGADREFVWPQWSKQRGSFARTFQKIVAAAGLRGSFGRLRKTSGTEVERLSTNAGWLHLGHTSPETARRWYLNPERAYDIDRPLPPPLPLPLEGR